MIKLTKAITEKLCDLLKVNHNATVNQNGTSIEVWAAKDMRIGNQIGCLIHVLDSGKITVLQTWPSNPHVFELANPAVFDKVSEKVDEIMTARVKWDKKHYGRK